MKKVIIVLFLAITLLISSCGNKIITTSTTTSKITTEGFINPGDSLGGGGEANGSATAAMIDTTEVDTIISSIIVNRNTTYDEIRVIDEETTITAPGNYLINSSIEGKIEVNCENVHLFLNNASITNGKKVIDSTYDLLITVVGTNTLTNTNTADTKNVISCSGDLTINGTGTLQINSVKNGIKVDKTLTIADATLDIDAQGHGISAESIIMSSSVIDINCTKDGLHAEIDYDTVTNAPAFTNEKGYIYLNKGSVNIISVEDGMQSDSFVYIDDGILSITANNGAPAIVTEVSSDNVSGRGIKAGEIDYTIEEVEYELTSDKYGIIIKKGAITINSNDDAMHSSGYLLIDSGTISINTGDDGLHAETVASINNGTICVTKSYEALEAAKVQINGGTLNLIATDDGINAADGTTAIPGFINSNCHIIITGGSIYVNAGGDGVDSNGLINMTGGILLVDGPKNGSNGSIDSETGFILDGGTLFACGSLGMVETPTRNSKQYVVSFASKSSITANTILTVYDSNNNVIITFTTAKSCASVIISSPDFVLNDTYTIYGGDTLLATFTINDTITSIGTATQVVTPGVRPPR